jgi:hypothetical protein
MKLKVILMLFLLASPAAGANSIFIPMDTDRWFMLRTIMF